jgi:UDP-glucose 4-epimerase
MKCLITGGAGFIGSNLADELLQRGDEVVVVDNESAESNLKFYWNQNASNYPVDICDYNALSWVFRHEKPEIIFHMAAEARIQPSIKQPQKACQVNFVGTCNILQAAREFKAKRVIYSSTSSMYGRINTPPLVETMPKDCLTPYSVSKAAGEDLCRVYNNIYSVETITLRYFNVYGSRQPIKGHYAPVIGKFIEQKNEGKPMTVVGDGLQTRDFTHIKDVVNANVLAAETKKPEALGQVFNIGAGKPYTILDIAKLVGGEYIHIDERPGEARHTLADCAKARKILGWKPEKSISDYLKLI